MDENGLQLLDMLDEWQKKRGDIEFQNTTAGFNISLITNIGEPIILFVVSGPSPLKRSQTLETRQHLYPESLNIERGDIVQITQHLQSAHFQVSSGGKMNARLEFGNSELLFTPERLKVIEDGIDATVEIIKAKVCKNTVPFSHLHRG
jgi:hypothetical protein